MKINIFQILFPALFSAFCCGAVAEEYDYSLADTPNKRTALEYIYMAYNGSQFDAARKKYYDPDALKADEARRAARFKAMAEPGPGAGPGDGAAPPPPNPKYTIKRVVEEGDIVVVLAFVEGVGIGDEITTFMGTSGGVKIGDAVVEIIKFDSEGKMLQKWDIIEPLSEATYDFK